MSFSRENMLVTHDLWPAASEAMAILSGWLTGYLPDNPVKVTPVFMHPPKDQPETVNFIDGDCDKLFRFGIWRVPDNIHEMPEKDRVIAFVFMAAQTLTEAAYTLDEGYFRPERIWLRALEKARPDLALATDALSQPDFTLTVGRQSVWN